MEPLFMSIYGTPDPFSHIINPLNPDGLLFSSCSQRCAVSRYIGIGTYDTDTMIKGKLVTVPTYNTKIGNEEYGWYKKYYENCAYNKLNELGYDINFNKHFNHGVEIRFFDHINDINMIEEVLEFLVYLGDYAIYIMSMGHVGVDDSEGIVRNGSTQVSKHSPLVRDLTHSHYNKMDITNPINSIIWNNMVVDCMRYGKNMKITDEYINMYSDIFNLDKNSLQDSPFVNNLTHIYYEIFNILKNKSKKFSPFSSNAMNTSKIKNSVYFYI